MKKLTALLLAALTLTSCTAGTDDIAEGLETYRDVYGGTPAPAQTEAPDETETEPALPEEDLPVNFGTTVEGIVSNDFAINDGKMYLELKSNNSGSTTHMSAYIDLATGNYTYVCPDPLCSHDDVKTCKYFETQTLTFTDKPGICYAVRFQDQPFTIYRVDLNRDTMTPVQEYEWLGVDMIGYTNGKMYYTYTDDITENRQTKRITTLYAIDDASGGITEVCRIPEEWKTAGVLFQLIHDGKMYFCSNEALYITDTEFNTPEKLADLEGYIGPIFLDTTTGELFFSDCNPDRRTGSVYLYRDGEVTELNLPHGEIYYFTMDNERFYYSVYDPIYYGISKTAHLALLAGKDVDINEYKVYDYSGGKIYAVDRTNPSQNAELIYDNNGETMLCNGNHHYTVVNGCLYYDEVEVMREVIGGMEYTYFASSRQQNKIRVNLADGTTTKISFE